MSLQESPTISMAKASKIIRKSIHTFLQNYHYLTSIATFIALPFSISLLISQALVPRSITLLPTVFNRLESIFYAIGFTQSSTLSSIISLKLSQTISTWSLTLPFTLSFLLLAKASIINLFKTVSNNTSSFLRLYNALLTTQLCNSLVILSVNSTCFSIFFLAKNLLEDSNLNSANWAIVFSIIGAILYCIVLANAIVICNFALISSGLETRKTPGFMAILRACLTIKGKTSTALALAVPINLGLAAIEALFHYRIIKPQEIVIGNDTGLWLVALEGVLIAYLYSIVLVIEIIMSCFFYQSCKNDYSLLHEECEQELDIEDMWYYENVNLEKLQRLEDCV